MALNVNEGVPTITLTSVLALLPPASVPTTLTVYVAPFDALAGTDIVAVLVDPLPIVIMFGENVAVGPPLLDLADSEILPPSLPAGRAVIEVVALPPGGMVRLFGLAFSVNPAVTSTSTCAVAVLPVLSVPVRLIV
jgi:hypothetical protein